MIDGNNMWLNERKQGFFPDSTSEGTPVNRQYKANVFALLFSEAVNLLELYNAVNGTGYTDPDDLEINTLKNAVYMAVRNDVSFILDLRINIYEHQSTVNPNLPLRDLEYIAALYSVIAKDENLYSTKQIQIPTPRFIVFYNGTTQMEDITTLRLSDAFTVREDYPSLELEVTMFNINRGHNRNLMEACKTLEGYAEFTARCREYSAVMPIGEAVDRAIDGCIEEGYISEFLSRHRAEVRSMSIFEYDYEKHMKMERRESYEDGFAEGEAKGRAEGVAKTKAETSRILAGRGFKASDIAEIVNARAEEVEQWLLERNDRI